MAFALTWSDESSEDLSQLRTYIARDSPTYADDFVLRVIVAAESLTEMPEKGRVVPETRDPTLRELIVGNYRLVYRIRSNVIEIVGVIHGARLLPERDAW